MWPIQSTTSIARYDLSPSGTLQSLLLEQADRVKICNAQLASVSQIDFFVCVGLVKMSIMAFNMRLTSMCSRAYRITNLSFMIVCGLYTIAAFSVNIFRCYPVGAGFDLLEVAQSGSTPACIDVATMNTFLRVINIVTDYCLLAIPISVIWKVRISRSKKLKLCVALGFGSLACVGSVMTLVSKFNLKNDVLCNKAHLFYPNF